MRAEDLPLKLRRKLLGDQAVSRPPKPAVSREPNVGEATFRFQIRAAGLPEWKEQFKFDSTREFRADFAWPRHDLLVEIAGGIFRRGGGAHSRPIKIIGDMRRRRRAVSLGYALIEFTPDEVKDGTALRETEEFLRGRGWRP